MNRLFPGRPSPSLVISVLALVFAMAGGAAGATLITGKQVKNSSLTGADVKNSSLTGSDVKNKSLTPRDFSGSVRGPAGPAGAKGDPGPSGPVGPTFATMFANPQDPTPPATPDTAVLNGQYSHTFVTPTSGRLLVFASLNALGVTCSVGNGNAFLYLDGVGVPGSGQRQPTAAAADPFTVMGLTAAVPAGEHTLTIALDCPMGNETADASSGDGDLGAVLVGG